MPCSTRRDVSLRLLNEEMVRPEPGNFITIDGITTLSLPDLIGVKVHSGSTNPFRGPDIADVIG